MNPQLLFHFNYWLYVLGEPSIYVEGFGLFVLFETISYVSMGHLELLEIHLLLSPEVMGLKVCAREQWSHSLVEHPPCAQLGLFLNATGELRER